MLSEHLQKLHDITKITGLSEEVSELRVKVSLSPDMSQISCFNVKRSHIGDIVLLWKKQQVNVYANFWLEKESGVLLIWCR